MDLIKTKTMQTEIEIRKWRTRKTQQKEEKQQHSYKQTKVRGHRQKKERTVSSGGSTQSHFFSRERDRKPLERSRVDSAKEMLVSCPDPRGARPGGHEISRLAIGKCPNRWPIRSLWLICWKSYRRVTDTNLSLLYTRNTRNPAQPSIDI